MQNYPNPFNPSTLIKFNVPVDSRIRGNDKVLLKIYDILGKEIETLVNEKLQPGSYSVEWNASQYPSGVYFYSLVAGEFRESRKMILLK
jgi:flagellar hook assembly protein FlgD